MLFITFVGLSILIKNTDFIIIHEKFFLCVYLQDLINFSLFKKIIKKVASVETDIFIIQLPVFSILSKKQQLNTWIYIKKKTEVFKSNIKYSDKNKNPFPFTCY